MKRPRLGWKYLDDPTAVIHCVEDLAPGQCETSLVLCNEVKNLAPVSNEHVGHNCTQTKRESSMQASIMSSHGLFRIGSSRTDGIG